MTEYKSFINSIYGTINDKNMSDTEKSNIVIDGIQRIMSKSTSKSSSQSKKTDDSKMSCSSFTNTVVQFVCKLDKNKEKLCNIPKAVAWALGEAKINTVISFITKNDAFVDAVWERSQMYDDSKKEITRLLNSLADKPSETCVKPFLQKLIEKSTSSSMSVESRPSSTSSLSSVGTSLTSRESTSSSMSEESRPSSMSSRESTSSSMSEELRPSSMSSLTSVKSDVTDTEEVIPSSKSSYGDNKRYGKRFLSLPTLPKNTPTTVGESLNDEQKNPNNMWKDESQVYNPSNMWKDEEDFEGGKTRRKRYRNKKRKGRKTRKGIKTRKGRTRSYKK
jgi:hypothetical protein